MKLDPKTIAIVSYITFIGWIVAIVLHSQQRSELAAFHLRQTLGLYITAMLLGFVPLVGWLLSIALLVLWFMGLMSALQGERKPVPVVGQFYQDMLTALH